jgi:protease-4
VRSELGDGTPVPLVTEEDYSKVSPGDLGLGGGSKIAVIHASGILVSGDSIGRTVMGESVGSNTIVKAFKDATSDHDVKAIVFRIDSPGGSPYAADEIWKQIRAARAKKPVIASLGNVAASGGYYIAAAADHIVTDAMTLTGSIGVVMFKPNFAGLLDRFGISEDSLSRGRYSRLMDTTKGLDEQERTLIRTQMGGIYNMFLNRVAEGRGMKAADVDKIGGGRVWTGAQAVDLHLADEIGGFKQAVAKAAEAASIPDASSVELVFYPQPKGIMQQLADLGGTKLEAAIPPWLGSQVAQLIEASTLQPGIYALQPAQLTIH